jgi:hypothetical protein
MCIGCFFLGFVCTVDCCTASSQPIPAEVVVSPLHLAMVRVQSGASPSIGSALVAAVKCSGALGPWNGAWTFALKVCAVFASQSHFACLPHAGNVLYSGPSRCLARLRAVVRCQDTRSRFSTAVLHICIGSCGGDILCGPSNQNIQVRSAAVV